MYCSTYRLLLLQKNIHSLFAWNSACRFIFTYRYCLYFQKNPIPSYLSQPVVSPDGKKSSYTVHLCSAACNLPCCFSILQAAVTLVTIKRIHYFSILIVLSGLIDYNELIIQDFANIFYYVD